MKVNFELIENLRKDQKISMCKMSKALGYKQKNSYKNRLITKSVEIRFNEITTIAVMLGVNFLDLLIEEEKQ